MLTGNWKNIEELEEEINLNELEGIVKYMREREQRDRKFFAALQGVNLDDEGTETAKDLVQRKKAKLASGKTDEELDLEELGLEVETVE